MIYEKILKRFAMSSHFGFAYKDKLFIKRKKIIMKLFNLNNYIVRTCGCYSVCRNHYLSISYVGTDPIKEYLPYLENINDIWYYKSCIR